MRIIYSLIGVVIGVLLMKYSIVITDTMGRVEWAERYLRSGMAGTYTMYKLVGAILVLLSLLFLFGLDDALVGPLAPLFGG